MSRYPPTRTTAPPISHRTMGRLHHPERLFLLLIVPNGPGYCQPLNLAAADDVSMRVNPLAQDAEFNLRGRQRGLQRLANAQVETSVVLDLLKGNAGVHAEDFHALTDFMIAQDGQVGDDAIRAGSGGQAG